MKSYLSTEMLEQIINVTETVQFKSESGKTLLWAVISTVHGIPIAGPPLILDNEATEEDVKKAYQLSLIELVRLEEYRSFADPVTSSGVAEKDYEV